MFEFDELEAALPPEAYVVSGAGSQEVDGIYTDIQLEAFGAPIFRHAVRGDQLLSRELCGERHGWLIGANRRPLYGVRTEAKECPARGWRAFKGQQPAPLVEGFASLADASLRLATLWREEADELANRGKFRHAADVLKRCLAVPLLSEAQQAEIHALRARSFRQLAESKKTAFNADSAVDSKPPQDREADPLHGLAAEWAVEAAEEALRIDPALYLAAWEGAVAAKHIGWWSKGRVLAKKAMQAVPAGPEHRTQREAAGTLFLLMAEEEQAEKTKKVRELQKQRDEQRERDEEQVDQQELEWATNIVDRLNDSLKADDFRRPHHQFWKMISPGLQQKDSDYIFGEIRDLVWQKWNPLAWQQGYRTAWDVTARKKLCSRIVDMANTGKAPEVKRLIREIEDRVCLTWQDIPEAFYRPKYDETWAYTRRADGSWGAWNQSTTT